MSDRQDIPEAFIGSVATALRPEAAVRALFLAGSRGRGNADAHSDIDFLLVAAPEDHEAVARRWRETLESLCRIVFWNERKGRATLLNAITSDWMRCDLLVVAPTGLAGRAQDRLRPLLDRDGAYAVLPPTLPPKEPDPARVRAIVEEFIRVLGLLAVGAGRREHYLLVVGVGLLRDQLLRLMLEEVPDPDPGGALHLSRLLSPEQMRVLEGLPFPRPIRSEAINAHMAMARAFFPRARRLAARLGVVWPEDFEEATRQALERQLGQEAEFEW